MAIQTILVATDLGPHSAGAIEHAADLVQILPLRVHIAFVNPDVASVAAPEPFLTTAALPRADARWTHGRLREIQRSLLAAGAVDCDVEMVLGRPADAIADLARKLGADLIVVGTRGGGGRLRRLLLGSVSERICRLAPCPVTVVRGALSATSHPVTHDQRRGSSRNATPRQL